MNVWTSRLILFMNDNMHYEYEFDTSKERCEYEFDKEGNRFKKENDWLINVIPNYIEINKNGFNKTIWRGYDHQPTEDEIKGDRFEMITMMNELLEYEYKNIQSEYEGKIKALEEFKNEDI